jgi:hypothetical protein
MNLNYELFSIIYVCGFFVWILSCKWLDTIFTSLEQHEKMVELSQELFKRAFDGDEKAMILVSKVRRTSLFFVPFWGLECLGMACLWTVGKGYLWRVRRFMKTDYPELLKFRERPYL